MDCDKMTVGEFFVRHYGEAPALTCESCWLKDVPGKI